MTEFLYPFLEGSETDLPTVLADVRASTLQKGADTIALRLRIDLEAVVACGEAIRAALERGGRLLTFGNGGSSTDAQDLAHDCRALGWPALALVDDVATITAVGNDVGFENVFARQLIALARGNDAALAISTSGSSRNILAGLEEAQRQLLLTCAITGGDGGRLRELELDHLLVADGDYVPRVQEAHATVYHLLLEVVGAKA
ncbi:MAG: SIS domain-containing protein [Gaiellaceae bacterium MAG52_C11]|nr:SIS domain-containing protein [Candidatus Gaiellasilicea maunaloa]